ncbi:hypothetical protein KG091_05265 [Carnobacteriaceae bacterium zg-ZUI78]|nr:hypothetical protein [Carnobacteriaceae bacterium zg-ZUI78]
MVVDIIAGAYALFILFVIATSWRRIPKSALTSLFSGAVLLAYCVVLHINQQLVNHTFVVILSVTLLQLAPFEIALRKGRINWLHHTIRFALHAYIVWALVL